MDNFRHGRNEGKLCETEKKKKQRTKEKQTKKSSSEKLCVICHQAKYNTDYSKGETVCKLCCDDLFKIYNSQEIKGSQSTIIDNKKEYKMTLEQNRLYSSICCWLIKSIPFHEILHLVLIAQNDNPNLIEEMKQKSIQYQLLHPDS